MKDFPSTVEFEDLKDGPSMAISLPSPLLLGTRLNLRFLVRRKNGSRTEELRIDGEYKVTEVTIDARAHVKQLVKVAATRVAPSWRAIKNPPTEKRLGKAPTRSSPRTTVV